MHARPWSVFLFSSLKHWLTSTSSFYCMVLLSTMYVSLCYWPPVPTDTPLAQPWAENITTFADAIRHRMPTLPPEKVPAMIAVEEHCWCDVSSGAFSPVNLTKWEEASVNRLVENLEFVIAAEKEADRKRQCEVVDGELKTNGTSCDDELQSSAPRKRRRPRFPILDLLELLGLAPAKHPFPLKAANDSSIPEERETTADVVTPPDAHLEKPSVRLPWLRREYDLRRFGFAMVLDFGWSSSHS